MDNTLLVYNGEKISRGPLWYIIALSIIIFLTVYSFLKGGIMGGISVVFIFLVVIVSYIILYLLSMKKVEIKLYDDYMTVGDRNYFFSELLGFNVEFDKNNNFTTFIIVPQNTQYPLRYTILEKDVEKVKSFVSKLIELGLPVNNIYENDKLYKLIRFLKLG